MTALAASTNHTASASSLMHSQIDALTASATAPLHIEKHRERFQERALTDLTVNSNDTAMLLDPSNPTLVGEEMEIQKAYFRRLKFSYLEQEAKRNFLFSITGDDPQAVQPGENEELEAVNAESKAELKAYKTELEHMRVEAIELAKSNEERHVAVRAEVSEVAELQKQIRDVELELARIKATHPAEKLTTQRLTVSQANQVLDDQIVEMERLNDAITETSNAINTRREEVKGTTKEIARLSREREKEEARAKEVRMGREAGDTKVDELCRWLTSSIQFYRSLIGIRNVSASIIKEYHVLTIEYDVPASAEETFKTGSTNGQVELRLWFDAISKRLAHGDLVGSDLDVDEAVNIAVGANDVPGLVGEVLARLRPVV